MFRNARVSETSGAVHNPMKEQDYDLMSEVNYEIRWVFGNLKEVPVAGVDDVPISVLKKSL